MKSTSVLFFSSSSIALPLLEAMLEDARFSVVGLVCQPDKPAGRGETLTPPPTKVLAEAAGVSVYQPEKLSAASELLETLRKNPPDFLLTFAYGQFLSAPWLDLPLRESLNVHPSLLPKYRGPAPLEGALLSGEKETGITLMRMAAAMDAGPIAFQRTFPLEPTWTVGELYPVVASHAAEWIPDALFAVAADEGFVFEEQDEAAVSFTKKLGKEDAYEDFKKSTEEVLRRYRAFTPWPGLWTTFEGKRVKLLKLENSEASLSLEAGEVKTEEGRVFISTADSSIEVLELQMEGKKTANAVDFIRGYPSFADAKLPS